MSATAVPSPERVLRRLFWMLLFRGRVAQQAASAKPRRQLGLGLTLGVFALIGIIPALFGRTADCFIFASALHGFTMMFASLSLATSAGTMLFMKEEAEILLHRPVTAQQMLRAKCAVLTSYSLLLALALNLAGFFMGVSSKGSSWLFVPAHLLSTALLMLFSAACIVLVYNVCLKWFGRERFDGLLASMQALLTIVMVMGGQIMPHVLKLNMLEQIHSASGWLLLLPPVWFGSLDALIAGTTLDRDSLWLPAGLGIAVTAMICWLAFEKLGAAYGQGLLALNETTSNEKSDAKPRGRWIAAMLQMPPLCWWLRDPVERQAFALTTAYSTRDRDVKLRLYPSVAPMLIMPIMMMLTGGKLGDAALLMQSFVTCFIGIVPLQAMLILQHSAHWRAADFYRCAPLAHWLPLFHGTRKAVLALLTLPVLIIQGVAACWLQHSLAPLALTIPSLLFLPVLSLVPGLTGAWLPLSKPTEDMKNSATGCMLMAGVMIAASVVGGLASLAWSQNWYIVFLLITALVMITAHWSMTRYMRGKRWLVSNE